MASAPEETAAETTSPWPVIAVGAASAIAVLGLAIAGDFATASALLALLVIGVATAVGVLVSERSRAARYEGLGGAAGHEGEAAPFRDLVEALPDPIAVISATEPDDILGRRIVFANAAAGELLRFERSEGLLVNAIRDPMVLEAVDQALFGGREAECVFTTTGVQPKTLRAVARPLGRSAQVRKLALLVFRDETEMRQVERTRVDFLANASHELRTPLASLTGFIETLRGHAKDDPAARDRFLGVMQAQAARMARLIDDLMSLSRIELAEHIAPSDRVDVATCVQEVLEAMGPIAESRGVQLRAKFPRKGAALAAGERDQIVQVVQNLVDNALKYAQGKPVDVLLQAGLTPEAASAPFRPGAQRLSLLTPDAPGGTYVALRVSDRGPGLLREHLPRLTERFYRVEGQKSGERSGSGLGLAIVKHIVNRHRGGMTVESAPGEGATFTAYLPMASPKPSASAADVAKLS